MTYSQAVHMAIKLAKAHKKHYFVVTEFNELHVATEFDLDTFFSGISDRNILWDTGQQENSAWE